MELAWQFGYPVSVLMQMMPSYELPWWKAFAKIRHEEGEQMRVQAEARNNARKRGGSSTMGQR
jgi:ribosomal protein S13